MQNGARYVLGGGPEYLDAHSKMERRGTLRPVRTKRYEIPDASEANTTAGRCVS